MSARRLLLVSLAAIALLDAGRSYYARAGGAAPTRTLQSDAAVARSIVWPPGADVAPDSPLGARVYAQRCAVCHGADGKGNGPAAPSLRPRPRDFTRGVFKFKSTRSIEPPRLEDVRRSIRDGIGGTSMPAWRDLLSADEIDAVSEYVRTFGPIQAWTAPAGEESLAGLFANADAARGKKIYHDLSCFACHGEEGRGDGAAAPELRDVWKQPVGARDLTAPWNFRWGNAPATVYHWIAEGLSGTPMPVYSEVVEPQGIADLVAFLESIARVPPWQEGGELTRHDDPVERGKYLVRAGMCTLCHTPIDDDGIYQSKTHDLAGGMKIDAGAHGVFFAANLTPDNETGLGGRDEAQIAAAIQVGHARDRRLNYWAMPWMVYGSLRPDDALAIAAYLKTLPPVRNSIPQPLHYGTLETIARKALYPWPSAQPPRLTYAAGNFGREEGDGNERTALQPWLIRAQIACLLLALFAWMRLRSDSTAERRHGGATMILALLAFVVAAAAAFVERYPALGPMPPGPIVGGFAQTIAAADSPLRERGRYLFTISSCAFCHQGDGGGGNKVSWRAFGTAWSGNLTSHESGLGSWSDDDVVRVLRSGVRRDGRQIHWQSMPWDHFSNYNDEDLRSLVAYVRGLPAVERSRREAIAPAPGDCSDYTFWLRGGGDRSGCESSGG
jgi:mono/diheme cytochrome c family protein